MMRLPKMDYVTPFTVEEACSLLDDCGATAKVLAGGTDLLVACKLGNTRPALLVSLKGIQELKGISFQEAEGIRIGAMTSLYEVRYNSFILDQYPALAQAAAVVGTVPLQYMGTLGGNLCINTRCIYYNQSHHWRKKRAVCLKMGGDICHVIPKGKKCYAVFSADTPGALIALGAHAKLISSNGDRTVPVSQLYTGDGKEPLAIKSGEVLVEISLPPPVVKQSSVYLKYRIRNAIDFPLVGVAVRMDSSDGICTDCRVVLSTVSSAPIEVFEVGELFKGKVPSVELVTLATEKVTKRAYPVANTSGSTPAYRRKMAGILTRRGLIAAANRVGLLHKTSTNA